MKWAKTIPSLQSTENYSFMQVTFPITNIPQKQQLKKLIFTN